VQAGGLEGHDGSQFADGSDAQAALARAWALKDRCYSFWSSDPQGAVRAAEALRCLHRALVGTAAAKGASDEGRGRAALAEIGALAAWTDGIAQLIHGRMEAAVADFDAAAAAFGELGKTHPAAQTGVPKIMALAMLGRYDDAVRCAEAAQRALLAHGDEPAAGKVLLNLGNLHLRSERYAAAAPRFREAAALFARSGDREHLVMADLGLADTLCALGDLDEAARIAARARMRAHGYPVLQALAEESLALLELARGRFRDALAGLERARQAYAALDMPQPLAIAEKQLADAYLELRLLPEALAGFERALQRFGALGMQIDTAWTQAQCGRALALAGKPKAAAAALRDAAALFAAQDNTIGTAAVALARAELALVGGADRDAVELAGIASRAFRDTGAVERQLRADAVGAQALLRSHDIAAARALLDATLEAARTHQLLPVQLRCLTGRAIAARLAGDLSAARADLDTAVALFEEQRRALPGDEVRSAFQNDHLLPFEELLRLALQRHQAGEVDAAEVLAHLDRLRARTLADRLSGSVDAPTAGPQAQGSSAAMHDLRARQAWLYRRLQRTQDEATAWPALSAELRATERELLEQARRERLADEGARVGSDAGFSAAALQRSLARGGAVVEYGVLDDELWACVVTHDAVHVLRHLASWREVQALVQAARFQLEALRHGSARVQQHLPALTERAQAHLQRLHGLLWRPLAAPLRGHQRVLVVPQAQLGTLPFAALHDGQEHLVDQLQLAIAPSARMALHGLTLEPRRARRVLALGASARLAHAAHEAHAVAALLPEGEALVGAQATLAHLHARAHAADVLHFACHAQFRADNPQFSALHLDDGALTAETVQALHLPGTTVVLSACETALHDPGGGDEMFGLTRAFLAAGAARVVASLWPVDDAMTADLMSDFYAGLRRGKPPAAALRLAQQAARRRHAHPACWASFALLGGW
jgi:CHAT domain-containing protein/tetratricopeptide (TPR) repeat protein